MEQARTSDAAAWAAIAVLAAMVAALEGLAPLPIAPAGLIPLAVACLALTTVARFYRDRPDRAHFATMCRSLMQVLLFSAIGIVLSYLVARAGRPLWDAQLAAADRALGFDWLATLRWLDRRPLPTAILHVAYGSLIPQIVVLVCALGFLRREAALRTVMLGAILTGGVSIVVSGLMPALSYPALLDVSGANFRHVNPWGGTVHLADVAALRGGTMARLDLAAMQGIITFPSYHAGLSAVTLWGFLATGRRWLAVPGGILATLTIVATPVDGGHYLVDVLAGLAIAAACLWIARRAIRWQPGWALRASPSRHSRAASAR